MRSFFKVSVVFNIKVYKVLSLLHKTCTNFPKKVKKVCFQNGNTICEHNFHFLKYILTIHDQYFRGPTLKKKEQKRARAVQTDFLKKYFF